MWKTGFMVSGLPVHHLLGKGAWVTWPEVRWVVVKGRRGRGVGDDNGRLLASWRLPEALGLWTCLRVGEELHSEACT